MSKTVTWSNTQVMEACQELNRFLVADRLGALGYRAGQLYTVLRPIANAIETKAIELVETFQKEVGGHKIPASQDGREVPLSLWCSDPAEYRRLDRELMATTQQIVFPLTLDYEQLAGLNIRGAFWVALHDVIAPPKPTEPTSS
jgi:hypothetical protein